MFAAPFNPITGTGLGVSYSSLNQIGGIFPQKGIGQANVQCYVNMANGNLVIKDHMVRLIEINGPMELGFIFNAQVSATANPWQFAIKQISQLPNNQTAIMQEADGHLTTYTSSGNNIYTAPALNDGTPYFSKLNDGTWQWYHPKTQITEIYGANGLLNSRTDARGNTTNFIYDANNNLTNINGPSGDTYQISRTSTNIYIYDTSTGSNNLLQSYTIDSQGRITGTQTPDGYQVNYFYTASALTKITQSDGSLIQFNNQTSATYGNQVASFNLGNDVSYSFNYPTAQNSFVGTVTDGFGSVTAITLDQNNRITQITQQTGYDVVNSEIDITSVIYNPAGQVQSITKPEGQLLNQATSFQYGIFGLMTQQTDPNGQITQYNYYNDVNCAVPTYLISKTRIINNQNLTTFYVHDTNYDGLNHLFRRFTISPMGRVTQFQPDDSGNIEFKSQFFNSLFTVANLNPTTPTSLQQLTAWVTQAFAQQLPQQASLTQMAYDTRGQMNGRLLFANTDANGQGINDAYMGQEVKSWDEFGNLLHNQILQIYPATSAITSKRFDGLQRLTKTVDALNEVTAITYLDSQSQILTTYPNNTTTDTKTLEPSGLVSNDTANALSSTNQNQSRITQFARDTAGRTVKTTLPDGNLVYTFYDRQNRLGIHITPMGIVTQTQYDRVHNFKSVTTYANQIDTTKLINPSNPTLLPVASLALSLLTPDPLNDRTTYEFKDASNRVIWEVDGKSYGTQTFYDALNRITAKVTYSVQLSSAELNQLLQAQPVVRTPDFTVDQGEQYFYDNDNNKIGKLISAGYYISASNNDATGYLTQHFRDSASRIYKETRYATRIALNLSNTTINQVMPSATVNDATTFLFRDARGNTVATIDAGAYLTLMTNLPCGLLAQSTRYANQIAASWFTNPTTIPVTPAASTEDQITIPTYDLLSRNIKTISAMNRADFTVYDDMGNITSRQTQDENNPNSLVPSCMRGTQTQYDGWNQKTAEANEFINQLLVNPNLTPPQIAQIWQSDSTRHIFDATGLRLYSIMPPRQGSSTNDIYYYFYDADRRLAIIIDPNNNIIQKTLNSFNEPTAIRLYSKAFPAQSNFLLTGGFITAQLLTVLSSLQNSLDPLTQNQLDQRGQITQIIDPNGNITTKSYDAFKRVSVENIPVANQQPSMTITHLYEGRGKEIQTTKSGGGIQIITSSQYNNLYGKLTQFTNELNTLYNTQYDNLGNIIIKQEISPSDNLTITTHIFTVDAFGRVLTDTDSLQQITTHLYNQQNRTHIITYPVTAVIRTIILNIFKQKNVRMDSLGDIESWTYAANGKIAIYTDQLGNTTTDNFDLMGRIYLHVDAKNTQTSKSYDGASHLITLVADAANLALTTHFTPDAFGNNIAIVDPRNIITANTFDLCNNLTISVVDPNNPDQNYTGLNIIKTKTYNSQRLQTSYTLGDATTANQYNETNQIDGLNRPTGKTVDPSGLDLITAQHLDAASEVTADTDANGNTIYTFFNGFKLKRFVVDAAGGVYERNYDTEKRLIYERKYDTGINTALLSTSTTLTQLIGMVTTSAQDSYTYYFYDGNGNERFTVNSIGKVTEKRYDDANRKIQDTIYSTPNNTTVTTLNTGALITWASQNSTTTDHTTYHILDAKGQECFTINPNNIISQTVYNPNGKIISTVTFANPVNPAQILQLPLDQILTNINLDATRDSYAYRILDNLDRLIFEVDGEGNVTKHVYDGNNNETLTAIYKQNITVPQPYANIVAAVNALPAPTAQNASFTQKTWDNANRNTVITDPLNYTDSFQYDAPGNVKVHTDRNSQPWTNVSDRANRITNQSTPPVPVTTVTATLQPSAVNSLAVSKSKLLTDNTDADKITTQVLTKDANPQYPIHSVFDSHGNAGLFALALATKKAALKNPAVQNSLFHWPLIAQINEKDMQKLTPRVVKLGQYLRIAVAKSLAADPEFKNRQISRFISCCNCYLNEPSLKKLPEEFEAHGKSNKEYLVQMRDEWYQMFKHVDLINTVYAEKLINSHTVNSNHINSLYNDIKSLLNDHVTYINENRIAYLFANHCPDANDRFEAILKFYKLYAAVWARIDKDLFSKEIKVLFNEAVRHYLDKIVINEMADAKTPVDKLSRLLSYSMLLECSFDINGIKIKSPTQKQLNSTNQRLFIQYYLNITNNWNEIHQRYCEYVENNPVTLNSDELGCLAKYWGVALKIVAQNGGISQNYQTANDHKIQASLCHLTENHWQVVDINAQPLNDTEAYNPSNLSYRVRTKDNVNSSITPSPIVLAAAAPVNTSVQKQFVLDGVGNKKQITDGFGSTQPRTIINTYTPDNKLSGTLINGVPVDNSSMPASYQTRPESTVNVTTSIVYNAKRNKVAEQNENGVWTFYVYDSENREVYCVKQNIVTVNNVSTNLSAVTQKVRDIFGNVTQEISYFNPINLTLSNYTQTGIPLSVMQQAGVIQPDANDRTITKAFDNCDNMTLLQQGPVFYYLPIANGQAISGTSFMQTKWAYTAFNKCYLKSVLLNPQQNSWSQQLYWYNRTGKVIAECDPVYRVKIRQYDTFKNEVVRYEWSNQPTILPTPVTTYAQLISAYNWSSLDRVFNNVYDPRQSLISESKAQLLQQNMPGVNYQLMVPDPSSNVPVLYPKTATGMTKTYTYTATRLQNSITDEAGNTQYIFFDARGSVIANTDVPRTTTNNVVLVPLTYTYNDLFGKPVSKTKFKQGTIKVSNPLQLPAPIATDPADQTEYTFCDNRGLAMWKQDPDQYVQGFTHTPTRKQARRWNQLTNRTATNVDDYRVTYDQLERVNLKAIYRNGTLQSNFQTAILYDVLNQPVAEGDNLGNWPIYSKYDPAGNIWLTNKQGGVDTLLLTDLNGKVTLRGQSATQKLSTQSYTNLPAIINWGMLDLEKLQSQRDNAGRTINKLLPSFSNVPLTASKNLPLTFIASNQYPQIGKYTLTWVEPYETMVSATEVVLTPVAPPNKPLPALTIKTQDHFQGIDVSQIPSDVYTYEIKFYADNNTQNDVFHAKGTVEFNNNNNYKDSTSVVVEVQNGNTLLLSGNTTNLTAVQLWQNGKQIAQVTVQPVNNTQNYTADLSSYASGVYTILPVVTGSSNLLQSLPFTIYTAIPSPIPLAQQIPCQITLSTLFANGGQRAQLSWVLPSQFNQLSVNMTCLYEDINGNNQTQQVLIAPNTNLGVYTDSQGNNLTCNNNFAFQIKTITSVTVTLALSANENIIVVNGFAPVTPIGNNTTTIQINNFANSVVQYISPLPNYISPLDIHYLNTIEDRHAKPIKITPIQVTSQSIVLDTSKFLPGYYPFTIKQTETPSKTYFNSVFTVIQNGMVFPGHDEGVTAPVTYNPYYQYGLDNWNNYVYQIDTEFNKTTYVNTVFDKASLMTQPPVLLLDSDYKNGQMVSPITATSYDIKGQRIAITRPNGNSANPIPNTEGFVLDESGQMTADILADGIYADRFIYNAISQATARIIRVDGKDYNYSMDYDHRNNVVSLLYPTGKNWTYIYNEVNRRFEQTDAMKCKIYYDYDFMGNIVANYMPMGEVTLMEYERNNKPIKISYPDSPAGSNVSQGWRRDYLGYPVAEYQPGSTQKEWGHSDISGVSYYFVYDNKMQVVKKTSQTATISQHGQTLTLGYGYNNGANLQSANLTAVVPQKLELTYQRGLIVKAVDEANGKITLSTYDGEKRRTGYSLWSAHYNSTPQYLLRELTTVYDAISRESATTESQAKLIKIYDLNSNIQRLNVSLKLQGGKPVAADGWSTFDHADRVLFYNAHLDKNDNKIKLKSGGAGFEYAYKDGLRYLQHSYLGISSLFKNTYHYNKDGVLMASGSDNSQTQEYTTRGYDDNYRPKYYTSHESGSPTTVLQYYETDYNDNGYVKKSIQSYAQSYYAETHFHGGYYPDGQTYTQKTNYKRGTDTVDDVNNNCLGFDDFETGSVSGGRSISGQGTTHYSSATKYIDCNGIVNGQVGVNITSPGYNNQDAFFGTVILDTSYDGLVLTRHELINVSIVDPPTPTSIFNTTQFFYDISNNAVAEYTVYYAGSGLFGSSPNPPTFSGSHRVSNYGTKPSGANIQMTSGTVLNRLLTSTVNSTTNSSIISSGMSHLFSNQRNYNQQQLTNSLLQTQEALAQLAIGLDIIQPIDQSFPATSAPSYIAQPGGQIGQTTANIAQMQFSDPNQANNVASAGCLFNQIASAGQNLTMPQTINSKYQAGSAMPYTQFMNTVLMNMYPQFKYNPPPEHHSFLGEVVHAIVDVAAEIIGYALEAL